eukprot:s3333_g14.t1
MREKDTTQLNMQAWKTSPRRLPAHCLPDSSTLARMPHEPHLRRLEMERGLNVWQAKQAKHLPHAVVLVQVHMAQELSLKDRRLSSHAELHGFCKDQKLFICPGQTHQTSAFMTAMAFRRRVLQAPSLQAQEDDLAKCRLEWILVFRSLFYEPGRRAALVAKRRGCQASSE